MTRQPHIAQTAARLLINELAPRLRRAGIALRDSPISPEKFAIAVAAVQCGAWTTHDLRQRLDACIPATTKTT